MPKNETSITRKPYFPITLCTLIFSILSCVVVLALGNTLENMPTYLYLSEHRQLYDDWSVKPFVEIKVEELGGCQDGFEPIFTRMWNGTEALCTFNETQERISEWT